LLSSSDQRWAPTDPACCLRSIELTSAVALAGLTGLRALSLSGLMPGGLDLGRAGAAACAAAVAALPPSLQTLTVGYVGGCAEGAALVVPPGRAQQLELRCSDPIHFSLRTGQAAVGDVRAFMGWHRGCRFGALVLGACAVTGDTAAKITIFYFILP
jgi:hypothetical protein